MARYEEALTSCLLELPTEKLIEIARRCNAESGFDWRETNAITLHHALSVLGTRLSQETFLNLINEMNAVAAVQAQAGDSN